MPRAQQFIFWNPKTKYTRFQGASLVLLLLALAASLPACTSGNLCDADHSCGGDWECLDEQGQPTADGKCGKLYAVPLCDHYCTRTCQRGKETGENNPGDCPEFFAVCRMGIDNKFVCKTYPTQPWEIECDSDADCAGAFLVLWME